jgi:hypothetical protein
MVTKKLPGQDTIKMSYDTYDRMTSLSDGNLRGQNSKLYFSYDPLNRQTIKGIQTGTSKTPLEYTFYDTYDYGGEHSSFAYIQDNDFPDNVPDQSNLGRITWTKTLVLDGQNNQ